MAYQQFLAFDYGTKLTGVAIGNELSGTAQPLPPLRMINGWAAEEQLRQLIAKWQPAAFVLGLPATPTANSSGTLKPLNIAARVQSFAAYLQRKFAKPYYFIDERLSSRLLEARQEPKSKESLDSMVAAALLCDWLEQQAASNASTGRKSAAINPLQG